MTYETSCEWCDEPAEHSADIYYACGDHKADLRELAA